MTKPFITPEKDLDKKLTGNDIVNRIKRSTSIDDVQNASNLVTKYDKSENLQSRSILTKGYYDRSKTCLPLYYGIRDKVVRNVRCIKKEVTTNSLSQWFGLWGARIKQDMHNFWTITSAGVSRDTGSLCRSCDLVQAAIFIGFSSRVYYCVTHHLPKYRSRVVYIFALFLMPLHAFHNIFIMPCREDVRSMFNYKPWVSSDLIAQPKIVQLMDNFLLMASYDTMHGRVPPAHLRGDKGRYITIPEEYKHEADYEKERKHGERYKELKAEKKRKKQVNKNADYDAANYVTALFRRVHEEELEAKKEKQKTTIPYLLPTEVEKGFEKPYAHKIEHLPSPKK